VPVLESEIEQACVQLAKKAGCTLLKIQGARGWPDRILLCPQAKAVFMEFKRPGEDLRPYQKFVKATLQSLGFTVEKVDSVERFKSILAATLQSPGSHTVTKSEPSSG